MSQASEFVRTSFAAGDDVRDAGLTTPAGIRRFDSIPYGPDERWQVLDVYRPREAEGRALPVIVSVQSEPGCGTTIKHFACNNQEDNRMGSNSILSERTLREIYLKGFEVAIKTAQPLFIMTSYNLVNGVHTANNYDLCTAARDEWGFRGAIMTDWTTTQQGPDCTASGCMRAGNDIVMPGVPTDHENLRQELAAGTLSLEELKLAVCHLVDVIWRSNMYETKANAQA